MNDNYKIRNNLPYEQNYALLTEHDRYLLNLLREVDDYVYSTPIECDDRFNGCNLINTGNFRESQITCANTAVESNVTTT